MCGIAGFIGRPDRARLGRMLDSLVHRGPDDDGWAEFPWCSVGMRRLSIVDLEGGNQPFWSEDKRIAIVFNGEVYNHRQLRSRLEARGVTFQSDHSDTEVVLRLYEAGGVEALEDIVGMFAIAIVDGDREELHLIRDRIGERPLYYSSDAANGVFSFASEYNTIASDLGGIPTVDQNSLRWYFGMKSMPDDRTIDRRISRLPVGARLKVKPDGEPETTRYYRTTCRAPLRITESRAVEELERLLAEAIDLQLDADVEVGAFLSGGLDSSTVVSLAAERAGHPLRTFCLVYGEEIYNKSSDRNYARQVAQMVGSRHEEVLLTPELLAEELPKIVKQYGQPNSATMASWFVCKAMHGKIKVALSGDGADELFGSYFVHRVAAAIEERRQGASTDSWERLSDQERSFAERHTNSGLAEIQESFAVFPSVEQEILLAPSARAPRLLSEQLADAQKHLQGHDLLSRALEYEFQHALPEQVLNYVDVLAMAHSIEPRVPFLDHRLVEWVFSLPYELKNRCGETKYLLKRLAEKRLPKELVYRKKEGFIEPNIHWMGGPLKSMAEDYILGSKFNSSGLLNTEYTHSLARRFFTEGDFAIGKKVWTIFMFSIWEQHCLGQKSIAA